MGSPLAKGTTQEEILRMIITGADSAQDAHAGERRPAAALNPLPVRQGASPG